MKHKTLVHHFYLLYGLGLLAVPMVLLILPARFFDQGQSICLSQVLFHTKCYGCGMMRACQHLIHLDISGAWAFNRFSVIVAPLLAYLYLKELIRVRARWLAGRNSEVISQQDRRQSIS